MTSLKIFLTQVFHLLMQKGRYRFRTAIRSEIPEVAAIADYYFTSRHWRDGINGRISYFEDLYDVNHKIFWVLTYRPPFSKTSEIVGYISIIPEKRNIIVRHEQGKLNQYHLGINDIFKCYEKIRVAHLVIYVQAVAVLPKHRKSSKPERDKMFAAHLASMMANYEGRDFSIISEQFTQGGKRFMLNRGFLFTNISSPTGHPIYKYDSASKGLTELGHSLSRSVWLRRQLSRQRRSL